MLESIEMNGTDSRSWHDASPLAALMAATALAAAVTGYIALAAWRSAGGGADAILASPVIRLLFAVLAAAVAARVQACGEAGPGGAVYAAALGGLTVFIAYDGAEALAWLAVYPAIAALALGRRKGLALAALVGAAGLALSRDSGALAPRSMPAAALAYAALVALAYHAERRAAAGTGTGVADREAPADSRQGGFELQDSMARSPYPGLGEAQGEITVLYRQEAIETLTRLPSPEAVLSYLVLEGLAGDDRAQAGKAFGDYRIVSLGIDELLAKAEAIIEAREAKRLMEFNKIQAQIDASVSREGEPEPRADAAYAFDRLSFSYNLSEREVAVARCILKGMTNKEISGELFISIETVKTHVKNLFKKCEIGSRIEFVQLFSRAQPVPADDDDRP